MARRDAGLLDGAAMRILLLGLLISASAVAEVKPIRHLSRDIRFDPTELAAAVERCQRRARALADRGIDRVHLLVQFKGVPSGSSRNALEREGVRFGGYLPVHAWVVSVPVSGVGDLAVRDDVTWLQPWSPDLKLHPRVESGRWSPWSRDPEDPSRVVVFVQLHEDVALDRGAVIAASHTGTPFAPVEGLHGLPVIIEEDRIAALAAEEEVLWIEEVPPALTHTNDGAVVLARADVLWHPPYELNGFGVRLLVYDTDDVLETHETFRLPPLPDRVICFLSSNNQCYTYVPNHPTHVAGTAAGDGSGSDGGRGRGAASYAQILSGQSRYFGGELFWADPGWIEQVYEEGRNDLDADLANNSLGSNIARNGYDCDHVGDYGVGSELVDNITRGENTTINGPMLMVWANGNERSGTESGSSVQGRCGSNYHTTGPPACAKNSIQVGAVNSDGGSMTKFSSWGPCDDGRLKPIITAAGCETGRVVEVGTYSSLGSGDSDYGTMCGTSMAAPLVSGVLSQFLEGWRDQGYGGPDDRPLPALVKAMAIHTSRDRGNDGPDYIHGFGRIDAVDLVDLLRNALPGLSDWGTDTALHAICRDDDIVVPPGSSELKATVAWDDPAAAAYVSTALVNDLDLFFESPHGIIHRPWVLDPGNPMAAATTGINTVDNQEQVVVPDPEPGTWKRWVCGTNVPEGPQVYGLVTTIAPTTVWPNTCTELIANGSFNEGTAGWSLDGAVRDLCPGAIPGTTPWCLEFGGVSSDVDEAWTTVTIPKGVALAELSGSWFMSTFEGLHGHGYDRFDVDVRTGGANGTVFAVMDQRWDGYPEQHLLSNPRLPFRNIDLTPWAGQEIDIAFRSVTNDVYPSTFWIDNLSLEVCFGPSIFEDGFESSGTDRWDLTVP